MLHLQIGMDRAQMETKAAKFLNQLKRVWAASVQAKMVS